MDVPDGLGSGGSALWSGLAAGRKFDAPTAALVLNACRVADRLDELTAEIGGQLTVENDKGDIVANPLITEHRQQLSVLRQVLTTLGVGKLGAAAGGKQNIVDVLAEKRRQREEQAAAAQ